MPIKMDELETDIQMLLNEKILTTAELRRWCDQIEKTAVELGKLYSLVSVLLPEKTEGKCVGLSSGVNRLLSLMFRIQDTQVNFSDAIVGTKNRALRVLNKLEAEQEEAANIAAQGSLLLEVA